MKPGGWARVPFWNTAEGTYMSRATIWSVLVFTVFAFATVVIFFWIRDGSLTQAGRSMDSFVRDTGDAVVKTTGNIVESTGEAIGSATDGNDKT